MPNPGPLTQLRGPNCSASAADGNRDMQGVRETGRRLADSNRCKRPITDSDTPGVNEQECYSNAVREIPVLQVLRGKGQAAEPRDTGFSTPCWLWLGSTNSRGYGIRGDGAGRVVLAHRAVYESAVAPLDDGAQVHHRCEQKRCVRPDHLIALTARAHAREHMDDRAAIDAAVEFLSRFPGAGPTAIANATGLGVNTVRVALCRGLAAGVVRRLARGEYEVVA